MTSGMAHVSGAVMAAYVKIAGVDIEHLLTAVIMTAPATIMLAKIFVPETEKPATAGRVEIKVEKTAVNVIDAAAQGAGDGLHLALNIGAMLIAFLALIAMLNGILGWVHGLPRWRWLPGIAGADLRHRVRAAGLAHGRAVEGRPRIGNLLGTRLVLNEFVAFLQLGPLKAHSIRARSPSPPTRCAASPTSARSPFRSAASARWRPTASPTWRGSGCGPWWPARWPTSCRPASRGCCCESHEAKPRIPRRPHRRAAASGRGAGQRPGRLRGRA